MKTKIKQNYFLRNMVDCGIDNIARYLNTADQNYVIMVKGEPIVWAGDKTPVIYGDEAAVQNELAELGALAFDNDEARVKDWAKVLTEFDFLVKYCKDALCEQIAKEIVMVGEFDGTCRIFYPTKTEADIALYVGGDDKVSFHIGDGWGNLSDISDNDFARILEELYHLEIVTPTLYKK